MLRNDSALSGFRYRSGAAGSFLVIEASPSKKAVEYQAEMIGANSIPGLLPAEVRREDHRTCFYYNVTSKLPLSRFLKMKSLDRNEFIDLASGIAGSIIGSRSYLLYDRCFLLDEDFIYISPDSYEIWLAYVPVEADTDAAASFRKFFFRLIFETASINEGSDDSFLLKVINFLKGDFTTNELHRFLLELKGPGGRLLLKEEEGFRSSGELPGSIPPLGVGRETMPGSLKLDGHKGSTAGKGKSTGGRKGSREKRLVLAGVGLLQLVFLAFALLGKGFFKSLGDDLLTTYGAYFLVAAGIDMLLFRYFSRLLGNSPGSPKQEPAAAGDDALPSVSERWSMTGELEKEYGMLYGFDGRDEKGKRRQEQKDPEEKFKGPAESYPWSEGIPAAGGAADETTVLALENDRTPYLLNEKEGGCEKIHITRPVFLIGRLKGEVDFYIPNRAVGKIHAEIVEQDGSYYIRDLNSRNGTFVNGQRLDSNQEHLIGDNDRIMFANQEYRFKIPGS